MNENNNEVTISPQDIPVTIYGNKPQVAMSGISEFEATYATFPGSKTTLTCAPVIEYPSSKEGESHYRTECLRLVETVHYGLLEPLNFVLAVMNEVPRPDDRYLESYEALCNISSGVDIDYSSIDWGTMMHFMYTLCLTGGPLEESPLFKRLLYVRLFGGKKDSQDRDELADLLREALRQQFLEGNMNIEAMPYSRRLVLHERMHLADLQEDSGKLTDLSKKGYEIRRGAFSEEQKDTVVRIHRYQSLIADVMEARAFIAEANANLVHGDESIQYAHSFVCQRLLALINSIIPLDERKFKNFYLNETDQTFQKLVHEEHMGGALLLLYLDESNVDDIVRMSSYTGFLQRMPEGMTAEDVRQHTRADLIMRTRYWLEHPDYVQTVFRDQWDKLDTLFRMLVSQLEGEIHSFQMLNEGTD